MHLTRKHMLQELKDVVYSPAYAGYAVNGTFLTVGTWIEQHVVQLVAVVGLCITAYFNWRQNQRDKERLEMDRRDHELHLREHEREK